MVDSKTEESHHYDCPVEEGVFCTRVECPCMYHGKPWERTAPKAAPSYSDELKEALDIVARVLVRRVSREKLLELVEHCENQKEVDMSALVAAVEKEYDGRKQKHQMPLLAEYRKNKKGQRYGKQ